MVENDLILIWTSICLFSVIMYVVLDGFDLGIGMLFAADRTEKGRDRLMHSIAPFWDGNETWLVMAAVGLWAAFPRMFATIIPAIYIPGALMLMGLILRGVSFEFRGISKPNHNKWDMAFMGGSFVAAFCQGAILGTIIQGFPITPAPNFAYAGNSLEWLRPFCLLCGLAVVFGYMLLGCGFLLMKSTGSTVSTARKSGRISLLGMLACAAVIACWTPMFDTTTYERWLTSPGIYFVWIIPLTVALVAFAIWTSNDKGHVYWPFFGTILLFAVCFSALAIARAPIVVPSPTGDLTIWNSAGNPRAQIFLLAGTMILIPMILCYTIFNYWTFRGREPDHEEVH